jgi:hypothetical protein
MRILERAENREVSKGQVWLITLRHYEAHTGVLGHFPEHWIVSTYRAGRSKAAETVYVDKKSSVMPWARSGGFERAKEKFLQLVQDTGLPRTQTAQMELGGVL